jgi:basic membrane protein A
MKQRVLNGTLALVLLMGVCGFVNARGGADNATAAKDSGAGLQLRVAMLLPGAINDGGWNTQAYNALLEVKNVLGADIAYTENVKQNDQVQILRQYATRGYNVMIGHGFEFGDALIQVGEEFPDKYFVNYGGQAQNGKNVGSISYAYGQTGALMGVLIGMHKDVNKVGVVMAFEQATSQQEIFNIERHAKKYNPDIQFAYSYTGDWDDIAKGKEAAIALLNNGCQVIINELSGPTGAIVQAVQERNAKFVEITFDAYDLCPDNIISSTVYSANQATIAALKEIQAGTFKGIIYQFGLTDEAIFLGRYGPSVTEEMKAEVEKVRQDIKNGKGDLLILIKP